VHGAAGRFAPSCARRGEFLAESSPASNVTPGRQEKEPLRVLIVDDDRDTLLTLGLLLRDAGMYVHLLRAGDEVLAAVSSFRPDVIVLDLVLPERSGLEIAEDIVRRYGEDRPVMIAITAYSSDSDRRLAKAAGFNEFIAKPYDPAALLQRLAAVKPRI
jgi:CheY-like chemotaxis protein